MAKSGTDSNALAMPPGLVITLIAGLSLLIVFFLVVLSLLGRLRSRHQFHCDGDPADAPSGSSGNAEHAIVDAHSHHIDAGQDLDAKSASANLATVDAVSAMAHIPDEIMEWGVDKLTRKELERKLQKMGNCIFGFSWAKVPGGYRCRGGAHFVPDHKLA